MSAVTIAVNLIATNGTNTAFSALGSSILGTTSRLHGLGSALKNVSPLMVGLGTATVGAAAAFALFKGPTETGIQAASDLEQALTRLKFATQENASDMPLLTAAVEDLAVQTMYGVTDAAGAFERLTELGFSTQQIMYGMDDASIKLMDGAYHAKEATHGLGMEALFLGQALKADATDGAQLLGAALHTFEADGMSAAEAANYLAAAYFNGVPDVQALEQAIRNGGSTAATVGMTFQDFTITLDLLAQAGLPANMAATSLNYFINQLSAPTTKAAKALADLGLITIDTGKNFDTFAAKLKASGSAGADAVKNFDGTVTSLQGMYKAGQAAGLISLDKSFNSWAVQAGIMNSALFDANGNFVGMKDASLLLQDALSGVDSKAAKLQYIRDIFNIRGGQDARLLSTMSNIGDKYDQLAARFKNTDLGQLASDQLKTLAGSADQLKDTFLSSLATAFLPILPQITDLIHHITDLVAKFQEADPKFKTAVAVFLIVGTVLTGIAAIVLGVIVAIAGFIAIIGAAGISMEAIGIGLAVVAGAVAAIGLVIAGVIALKSLIENNKQVQDFFKRIGDFIGFLGQVWGQVWAVLGPTLADMGHIFGDVLGKNLDAMGQVLQGVLIPAWENLQKSFQNLAPLAQPALDTLKAIGFLIGSVLVVAIGFTIATITGIVSAIITFIGGVVTFVSGIITVIAGFFQIFVGMWQIVSGVVMAIVTGHFDKIGEIVLGGLQTMWNGVKTILGGLLTMVLGLLQAVLGTIISFVGGFIQGIISFFTHLFDVLVGHSIIPDMVNAILDWIRHLVDMFLDFITGLVTDIISRFLSLGVRVLVAINLMVNWVLGAIRGWVSGVLKLANDMVDGFLGFISSLPVKVDAHIHTLIDNTRKLLTDLKNIGLDAGKGLIDNLVSAIWNGIGRVKNAVNNIGNTIGSILHHSTPDEGPLKDDDVWGAHLVDNLIGGMQSRVPHLMSAASQVASAIRGPIITPQSGASYSGGGGGQVVIPINFDGKQVAQYVLDIPSRQLRRSGSTRYSR